MDWFRWWHGSVSDPKLRVIAKKSGQRLADVVAVWAAILEHASSVTQCNADVTRGDVSRFDAESIDALLDLDDGAAGAIFLAMADKGMVANGRLANWETRQPKREDSSAERVRRHREKKKAEAGGNGEKGKVTPCNADVTQSDAPEKIREEDKDNSLRSLSTSGDSAEPGAKQGVRDVHGALINKAWVVEHVFKPYAEALPQLPQPVESRWSSSTEGGKALMARLKEDAKHRDPEFWGWFWRVVATNPHWCGDNGWTPNGIAWFFKRSNFDNVVTRGVDNQRKGLM